MLKLVPICHCQCIGATAVGCHIPDAAETLGIAGVTKIASTDSAIKKTITPRMILLDIIIDNIRNLLIWPLS
jgi:hypothetical protein